MATHLPAALLFDQRILDFLQLRPLTSRDPKKILRLDLACGLHQDHSVSDNHSSSVPGLILSLRMSVGIAALPPCSTVVVPLVSLHCRTTCIPHRMFRPLDYQRSHS